MKKYLLLNFLIILCNAVTAQISITRSNFALSDTLADSATSKRLTISGITSPTFGTNQTWDYTNLRDSTPDLFYLGYITRPAANNRPAAHAIANLEQQYMSAVSNFVIPTRLYSLLNESGYYDLGTSTSSVSFKLQSLTGSVADSILFPAAVSIFSNVSPRYRFPMRHGNVWKSDFTHTTNFFLTIAAYNLNSVLGQRVHHVTQRDTVVGWGTLRLRNPSTGSPINFNALLVANRRISTDSFFLGGVPAPTALLTAFGLRQGQRDTSASLYFCGIGFKAPFLTLVQNAMQTRITNAFRAILPNLNLVTSLKDPMLSASIPSKIYPNPVKEIATLEFEKSSELDWNIMLYDAMGRTIGLHRISAPMGLTKFSLPLGKEISSGTYFYILSNEHSIIRSNGKIIIDKF